MNKLFIPTFHAKSVYDIDLDKFILLGVKVVFLDLDNTLDSYKAKEPSPRAVELKNKFESKGLKIIIVSNNTGKRVSAYASSLGVDYIPSIGKPFKKKILMNIKSRGLIKDEIIMIGDQTVTDIQAANRSKLKSILTDKIVKEDQPTTHFNRLFDRPLRRKLIKKNLLKEINSYGGN